MAARPIDAALVLANAGIRLHLHGEPLEHELSSEIADRRGYFDGPELTDVGYRVEPLFPERMVF